MIISNNMKNAILKNINLNKLTKNENHVYDPLNKYKYDDTNVLISSYLSRNKQLICIIQSIRIYITN